MPGLDLQPHGGRANLLEMVANHFADARRVLVGHEAAGDLRARPRGHDGFAASALITAGQAVDLKGGTRAALFHGREAAFAEKFFHTKQLLEFGGIHRQAGEFLAFVSGQRRDIVIKTGNGNASVFVAELAEQLAQGHRGIVHRAAEDAGVQVA